MIGIFLGFSLLSMGILIPFFGKKNTILSGLNITVLIALSTVLFGKSLIQSFSMPINVQIPLNIPFNMFSIGIDSLSSFFIILILSISLLLSIYTIGYCKITHNNKNQSLFWITLWVFIFSMILVCISQNVLLFLVSWEIMTLSSFVLVISEHTSNNVKKASWIYLVTAYIGTICLIIMFLLLSKSQSSMNFSDFNFVNNSIISSICLILGLIGFGVKMGLIPFHVWLPEAHPAAPTPVSALMSGVMIKMGVYGFLRLLSFFEIIPLWFVYTIITLGVLSGILGILFSLAQHDIKRLLAYSSIENIGIIMVGIGTGYLGLHYHNTFITAAGFIGAFAHIINHSLFKSLLFMTAGSVYLQTHTRLIDTLGGLQKVMPITGITFLIGSLAICGLPPFNGFISEFLMYSGLLSGTLHLQFTPAIVFLLVLGSLTFIGGGAAFCFIKAYGIMFLGNPRRDHSTHSKESSFWMTIPMIIVSLLCLIIGLSSSFLIEALIKVVNVFSGEVSVDIISMQSTLFTINIMFLILIAFVIGILLIRKSIVANRPTVITSTWDCGYIGGTNRMQYSGSSFVQPIVTFFKFFLGYQSKIEYHNSYFPVKGSITTKITDILHDKIYLPLFIYIINLYSKLHLVQQGSVQAYVSYILIALFVLLVWKLR